MSNHISACIVCRDEASKLDSCLRSLEWVDEIVVMDLSSSDGSARLARSYGAKVIVREPFPIVEPLRNELAAEATGPWILAVDPDERVRPGLAQELRSQSVRDEIDAMVVPRMNIDFGWEPAHPLQRYEPQLRMYRKDRVSWPAFPNRLPAVPTERTVTIATGDDALVLEHHRNVDVAETAERLVRYAPAQARAMLEEGREFTASAMLGELWRVARRHVLDARPWSEGMPGIARSVVLVNHHVYVWLAFWQISGAPRTAADDATLRRLGRVLDVANRVRQARTWLRAPLPRVGAR